MATELERAIEADLAVSRRCFSYGSTPLGGSDFVRPDGPKEIKDGKVFLRSIDGGHRGYWVEEAEYMRLRQYPQRHIGIWEFVSEDDPAAQHVAWAVSNPQAAGRRIYELEKNFETLKTAMGRSHG